MSIRSNGADKGGAIFCGGGETSVGNCDIANNKATTAAPGIAKLNMTPVIEINAVNSQGITQV